ncbi:MULTISPECIES: MarR family transcriptional regulator [unclassified Corynebacterium]|uniref:MarR family transcriptional regulator n=1 Tax=unclassified Corynebacterium TaxID=2624378 RepID=UPI0026536889|nr:MULTISPECIES: MarR family transcriptional regulator [unclassified Corynebacterium]MDN8594295.1 MarR family transcriptional regulator [Corynebacterium sp. P4_F2]WKK55162.1 MarR family transcriptional regulator [Corynebacterium sp. P4-C1]WKK62571.1 MarR family transcriptional regulator [Corynebacterium sp. P8-C1]
MLTPTPATTPSDTRPVHFRLPGDTAARCLQQARIHPGITRRQLQADLGLTQPTTTRLITRLETAGLVSLGAPQGECASVGRPSAGIYVHGADLVAAGAHVGKRETHIVLTDFSGAVVAQELVPHDVSTTTARETLEAIAWRLAHLSRSSPHPVRHVGVAFSADLSPDCTITSATYGWDRVPAHAEVSAALHNAAPAANFTPQFTVEVSTGVAAMAAHELAYTDLAVNNNTAAASSLYVYAREVLGYAWIVHGAIHRPRLGHQNPLVARLLSDSPLLEPAQRRGIDPLSVTALLDAAAERGHAASSLAGLVEAARDDDSLAALLDHRADILASVINIAVQVIDPSSVVFAGETFSADPQRTHRIAERIRETSYDDCTLKAYPANTAIVAQAAKTIALHAPWQRPLGVQA